MIQYISHDDYQHDLKICGADYGAANSADPRGCFTFGASGQRKEQRHAGHGVDQQNDARHGGAVVKKRVPVLIRCKGTTSTDPHQAGRVLQSTFSSVNNISSHKI